jgi:hypothetical protein
MGGAVRGQDPPAHFATCSKDELVIMFAIDTRCVSAASSVSSLLFFRTMHIAHEFH